MSSLFNVKNYYRFFNTVYANHTISAGVYYTVDGPINMTIQESFSSTENWQLYYQAGVYFIRNYQSGAGLQLGLTADDLTTPRLLNSSGALGQQWTITLRSDSTYRVTNGLVANSSSLGIAPAGATVPAMDTDDADGHWKISINQSAGTITDPAMLAVVQNVVASPTTSTLSSLSSSMATSTGSSSDTITSSPGSSATSPASLGSSSPSKSSPVSGGAIAGIIIGVLALAAVIAALVFYLMRRRNHKSPKARAAASEMDGTGKPFAYENEKRITPAAPPVEMDAEGQAVRTELGYK